MNLGNLDFSELSNNLDADFLNKIHAQTEALRQRQRSDRTTPADVMRIARDSVVVHKLLTAWQSGNISWDEAMMMAVVYLATENKRLLETATANLSAKPFSVTIPTG